jgi:hypothetical protein
MSMLVGRLVIREILKRIEAGGIHYNLVFEKATTNTCRQIPPAVSILQFYCINIHR